MSALRDLRNLAAALLLALPSCGRADPQDSAAHPGRQLFQRYGCSTCHRSDGRGGPLAPPLIRASEHWSREDLAEYLSDPSRYLERDTRLQALLEDYNAPMPGVTLDLDERLLLADYVLGLRADG